MTKDIRYSQHMVFERIAAQSTSVEELELRLAAEGCDLAATPYVVQDLMLLAMGYVDSNHSNSLPKQLDKVDEYDLGSWLPYVRHISRMFDVLCSKIQQLPDFYGFCALSAKQLIRYSCNRLQYACGDPQYQHDNMFKHTFYSGRFCSDDISAMLFEALLNHCNINEISKDEPIFMLLLKLLNIDNEYIQFAEGFKSTQSKNRLLTSELYDINLFKVRQAKNTIKVLLEHGANPNQKNNAGISFNDVMSIDDVQNKQFDSEYQRELENIIESMYIV